MKRHQIWDLPLRFFHAGFALCCSGALAIGLLVDDDSPLFPVHMLLGLSAGFLLVIRVGLAIAGSRHNKGRALLFSPMDTLRYLSGSITGTAKRYFVHNPGTSVVALAMFAVLPALIFTGLNLESRDLKEIHEFLAYSLLSLIGIHLAGLALHTVRYRENIALSMVTGAKSTPEEFALKSSQPLAGSLILLLMALWMGTIINGYDRATGTLTFPFIGTSLHLGESERDGEGQRHKHQDRH